MLPYLLLFVLQAAVTHFNSIFLYKKYQLKAGTSLSASTVFLIINGSVSALVSLIFLLSLRVPFAFTPYSFLMATVIVLSAASALVVTFKAYQNGSITTFSIISTVGGILINCLWGILFLKEQLSVFGYIGIALMILSALLMVERDGQRSGKRFWIFCALALVCNALTSLLSKQHQVETNYATVDTLSFSIWIGVVRTVIFACVIPFVLRKRGKKSFQEPLKASHLAVCASAISGSAYVLSLIAAIYVPIALSSPLGTGIGILLGALLPLLFFKETLSKRQIFGVLCSFAGVLVYFIAP